MAFVFGNRWRNGRRGGLLGFGRAHQQPPPLIQEQQVPPMANPDRQFVAMRDRFFHAMFVRLTLLYVRAVPARLRRLLECASLLAAICSLLLLAYAHHTLANVPAHCMREAKHDWPRDGILRVEIVRGPVADYSLNMSYAKEEVLKRRNPEGTILTLLEDYLETKARERSKAGVSDDNKTVEDAEYVDEMSSLTDPEEGGLFEISNEEVSETDDEMLEIPSETISKGDIKDNACMSDDNVNEEPCQPNFERSDTVPGTSNHAVDASTGDVLLDVPVEPGDVGSDVISTVKTGSDAAVEIDQGLSWFSRSSFDTSWSGEEYIVEYSLEYGLLRLSPETRRRLGVPIRLVVLDPDEHHCFGDRVNRLVLANFIGYDDVLLASLKTIAEAQNNAGYLRNVVTGEHFRFISHWSSSSSLFSSMFVMLVFTLTISMLLRYSHQQIYGFIVDLLQVVEANGMIQFPAAPVVTVVLALVGMEAVMSEFFNDSSTAFHVILMVWMVDQFDAVCCHTTISRKHFLRFFFLYHFCFYSYHYRFNGQFSGLALMASWLFTQHAMIFFLHHYELPVIVRDVHIQRFVTEAIQRDNMRRAAPGAAATVGGGATAAHPQHPNPSAASSPSTAADAVNSTMPAQTAVNRTETAHPDELVLEFELEGISDDVAAGSDISDDVALGGGSDIDLVGDEASSSFIDARALPTDTEIADDSRRGISVEPILMTAGVAGSPVSAAAAGCGSVQTMGGSVEPRSFLIGGAEDTDAGEDTDMSSCQFPEEARPDSVRLRQIPRTSVTASGDSGSRVVEALDEAARSSVPVVQNEDLVASLSERQSSHTDAPSPVEASLGASHIQDASTSPSYHCL